MEIKRRWGAHRSALLAKYRALAGKGLSTSLSREFMSYGKLRNMEPLTRREMLQACDAMLRLGVIGATMTRNLERLEVPSESGVMSLYVIKKCRSMLLRRVKASMQEYRVGNWLLSFNGIGPLTGGVIMSGFDVTKARTPSSFIFYSGMAPTKTYWSKKGSRIMTRVVRSLLCSLVKNRRSSFYPLYESQYGRIYDRNEDLKYKMHASRRLETMTGREPEWLVDLWRQGKIPSQQMKAMAAISTVRIFVTNVHAAMHVDYYGKLPRSPWPFRHEAIDQAKNVILVDRWPQDFEGLPITQFR